jgi:hypothetical protein
MTIFEKRNAILRDFFSAEELLAFQSSIESDLSFGDQDETKVPSQKEVIIRGLLTSEWVTKFDSGGNINQDSTLNGSAEIEAAFQKSLNPSFEGKRHAGNDVRNIFLEASNKLLVKIIWKSRGAGRKPARFEILSLREIPH